MVSLPSLVDASEDNLRIILWRIKLVPPGESGWNEWTSDLVTEQYHPKIPGGHQDRR
jgi:hypothetical protein